MGVEDGERGGGGEEADVGGGRGTDRSGVIAGPIFYSHLYLAVNEFLTFLNGVKSLTMLTASLLTVKI